MRERFIGVVGMGRCIHARAIGPESAEGDHCLVDMSAVQLPTSRIPVLVNHDWEFQVGVADWFEIGADLALRVHGAVSPVIARGIGTPDGAFAMSWGLHIDEVEPFFMGTVNGELRVADHWTRHIVTRSRLAEVSLVQQGLDHRCQGRLLRADDPAHLFASAFGPAPRRSAGRARIGAAATAIIRASGGEGKLATFEGLAYGGGPMTPAGWNHPVVVALSGVRQRAATTPALRNHDQNRVVGHMTLVRADAEGLHVAGVFSGQPDEVAGVVGPARRGFPWQLSIGANPTRSRFVPAGESEQVNGRRVEGPVTVAEETELGEVSFVAVGADADTSVHVIAQPSRAGGLGAAPSGRLAHARP
jgi:hypothetical protein